jgi:Zn-dependent metalloprotease
MVYGQVKWTDGKIHSLADSLEIVGHEMTHGITERSCGLEYQVQSGALNESYSDIFGIAIANANQLDVAQWDWELGEQVFENHQPFRDLKSPRRFKQPEHMHDLRVLGAAESPDESNDYGHVHTNSGIHNKVAYNLFTNGLFTWREVIRMFYLTLVTAGRLGPTSDFSDSKTGMVASCKSLFRSAAHADLIKRVQAVESAFSDAGI